MTDPDSLSAPGVPGDPLAAGDPETPGAAGDSGVARSPLDASPAGSITVHVEGLTKSFLEEGRGEVRAVDGIEFSCRTGEVFGLLGANGAGKTTTLRMLSTVLRPSSAGNATGDGA